MVKKEDEILVSDGFGQNSPLSDEKPSIPQNWAKKWHFMYLIPIFGDE